MAGAPLLIRMARPEDAGQLVALYAPYVLNTAVTFEYEVPSVAEFGQRMEQVLRHYPYLVAEQEERLLGYAYAGAFVGRAACAWAAEGTIYVERGARRCGIGGRLYQALEQVLREMHILNLNACIAYPDLEDEYLNKDSVAFHTRLGYRWVGAFHRCGYKFGRWYNLVWMEKMLGPHPENPKPVQPLAAVRERITLGCD